MHVVIIGAGVMGCATAWRLAQAGVRVTVLERALPGAEASSAAAGILGAQTENDAPGPLLDLCLASRALWPRFADELQAASGIAVNLLQHGLLEVCTSPEEVAVRQQRARWMQAQGLRAQWLDAQTARELEPALGPEILGALLLPDDGQVEPPLLAKALAVAATRAGAQILSGRTVRRVAMTADRVTGVQTDQEQLDADAVVIAAGAWTDLVPGLVPRRTPIQPLHGQLLLLHTGERKFRATLAGRHSGGRHGYVVPRADGRVVVGATSEAIGYDKRVTAGGMQWLLSLALEFVPALADARVVDHWSGLRPQSQDGLPLLGPHRDVEGLVFASGHHRNGILLTPVTADVTVNAVLGLRQRLDLAAFRP